jgi:hypothetical protein
MVVMAVILLVSVLGFGILFLTLHTLPERIAHKSHKLQFEIVAVLGLIRAFHPHAHFLGAGLLLALIDFPDFGGWLGRIAGSVEKIADNQSKDVTPPAETADAGRGNAAPGSREVLGRATRWLPRIDSLHSFQRTQGVGNPCLSFCSALY